MSHCDNIPPTDSEFARIMLSDREPGVDVQAAYRRVVWRARQRSVTVRRIGYGLAMAAAVALALLLLPVGSYARQFLAIFEAREFVPIYVTNADRKRPGNPSIGQLGRIRVVRTMSRVAMASPQAVALAGFRPELPSASALAATARYFYLPSGRVDFTFDPARVQQYERRSGRRLPAMPATLADARLRVLCGPGMVAEFDRANGQTFSIVEVHAPVVLSTGVSMDTIEKYLAAMPGTPNDVAGQLERLASPSTMLPIPLNARSSAVSTVDVGDAKALAVGDETGVGSAIVWRSNGIVYTISGSIGISEITKLANAFR